MTTTASTPLFKTESTYRVNDDSTTSCTEYVYGLEEGTLIMTTWKGTPEKMQVVSREVVVNEDGHPQYMRTEPPLTRQELVERIDALADDLDHLMEWSMYGGDDHEYTLGRDWDPLKTLFDALWKARADVAPKVW